MSRGPNGGSPPRVDEGLRALRVAFQDAVYINDDARECAELMMRGTHRQLEIPDAAAMQLYEQVTMGQPVGLTRTNARGEGYRVLVRDYAQLAALFRGELLAEKVEAPPAANDEEL